MEQVKEKLQVIQKEYEKLTADLLTLIHTFLLKKEDVYNFVEFIQDRITDMEYRAIKKDVSKLSKFHDILAEEIGTFYIYDGQLRETVLLKASRYKSYVYDIETAELLELKNIVESFDDKEDVIKFADFLITYKDIYR